MDIFTADELKMWQTMPWKHAERLFWVSRKVESKAKFKPILKACMTIWESDFFFSWFECHPGEPYVSLAELPKPRLILWQLGVARNLFSLK